MIQLKIRPSVSFLGKWACEEIGKHGFTDPISFGNSIQEAIDGFLYLNPQVVNYKWS